MRPLRRWRGRNCRGGFSAGCLVFLLFVLVLGYMGFRFGEAYWNYLEMRHKIRDALIWATAGSPKTDPDVVQKVIAKAEEAGVELSPRNVRVQQETTTLKVTVFWTRYVPLPYYTYPLQFDVTLTESKRWTR